MTDDGIDWVVLTTGARPEQLRAALDSLCRDGTGRNEVVVVSNGAGPLGTDADATCARVVHSEENLGVPGGRDFGIRSVESDVIGFLDDDAELFPGGSDAIRTAFRDDPRLAAVALSVTDEHGVAARRHIPVAGGTAPSGRAEVAYFVGCAHALRREAYLEVGGYFDDLFYGHEEIELCWRLIDAGWSIRFLDDVAAFHPRAPISRHARGWRMTGRNRVLIARRSLPWPVAVMHVVVWLPLGLIRAPRQLWRDYLAGWWSGWSHPVQRRPIRYRTVWKLTRLGRTPLI